MKKILTIALILFVSVMLFAACGEKKEEPPKDEVKTEETTEKVEETTKIEGTTFEGAMLSLTLPNGWTAKEETGMITVEKEGDPLMGITITELEGNTAPIDEVIKATMDMFKDAKVEEATVGANNYKKMIVSIATIQTVTLYASTSKGLVTITTGKFDDAETQGILTSIVLK